MLLFYVPWKHQKTEDNIGQKWVKQEADNMLLEYINNILLDILNQTESTPTFPSDLISIPH